MRTRELFKRAGFSDIIEDIEDFHYTELGPQIDVCGGVDRYFIVIDCTESSRRHPVSIKGKIRENHAKRDRILKALHAKKPGKYDHLVMGVCVEGAELTQPDLEESRSLKVPIIDSAFLEKCTSYIETFGSTLRYQILRRLGVRGIRIREGSERFFEFPAIAMRVGDKVLYSFCAEPEALLKLAYVERLDRFQESGYQRDLIPRKLRNINMFLVANNYFPNNLVVCFDNGNGAVTFVNPNGRRMKDPQQGQLGRLRIPKEYCIAEVIDGQHRLYGYLDLTGEEDLASQLAVRQSADRLSVMAIEDPGQDERPLLFVDINCNQTRVSMKNIWALMGDIRPTSQMGYIANLVKYFNSRGPLKGKIYIPGKNLASGRFINIANLGKGIKDRHLVAKGENRDRLDWNLFDGSREKQEYPEHPSPGLIRKFNSFFSVLKSTARPDWKRQNKGFVLTNNGLNVMLRVLVEILKVFHQRRKPCKSTTLREFVGREIGKHIEERTARHLRGMTSSEDGRAKVAKAIWARIARRNGINLAKA